MKIIVTAVDTFGPFSHITEHAGHVDGDGVIYPLDVIGSYTIDAYTPPAPQISIEQHNAPILAALAAIDAKSIRPLREGDTARVVALEAEAAALRAQLLKGQ